MLALRGALKAMRVLTKKSGVREGVLIYKGLVREQEMEVPVKKQEEKTHEILTYLVGCPRHDTRGV